MLTSDLAQILLLHTAEIKYMAMFAYTFVHGALSHILILILFDGARYRSFLQSLTLDFSSTIADFIPGTKRFATFQDDTSPSYRLVSMIFQCTGGGIVSLCLTRVFFP